MQAREQISESNIIPGAIDDKDKDQSIQEVLSPSHNLDRPRVSCILTILIYRKASCLHVLEINFPYNASDRKKRCTKRARRYFH